MTKIYTIQNDRGDLGWIQVLDLETLTFEDEMMGGNYKLESNWKNQFCVITKEEYEIIKNANDLYNEFGTDEYMDIINKMIDLTLARSENETLDKVL